MRSGCRLYLYRMWDELASNPSSKHIRPHGEATFGSHGKWSVVVISAHGLGQAGPLGTFSWIFAGIVHLLTCINIRYC